MGLWTQADREGRLEDRPLRLKASLFPYDALSIDEGLDRLVAAGLIIRYEGDGQRLIAIPTWLKHQQPHIREVPSELPGPEASTVLAPGQPLCLRKGADQEGSRSGSSAATQSDASPALLTFPAVGSGPKSWALTEARCAGWAELYPGLDVLAECRKALAWIQAHQPKTAKGMPAFLVNWFNRAVAGGSGTTQTARHAIPSRPGWERKAASMAVWACPHLKPCRGREQCDSALAVDPHGKQWPLKPAVSA